MIARLQGTLWKKKRKKSVENLSVEILAYTA